MPKRSGSTPAVAYATRRASGVSPRSRARVSLITTTAAAPSLICDELPAVTVPLTWNAGRSFASASTDVSRRGPSSAEITTSVVAIGLEAEGVSRVDVTGTISSVKRPASCAARARRWLSSA